MSVEKLRPVAEKYQEVQMEFEVAIELQQQLLSQLSENEQVQKEFANLASDARIYKRTGPVLVPQDFSEAKDNVEKRIEFIRGELNRVEQQIKSLGSKRNHLQDEIVARQQE